MISSSFVVSVTSLLVGSVVGYSSFRRQRQRLNTALLVQASDFRWRTKIYAEGAADVLNRVATIERLLTRA